MMIADGTDKAIAWSVGVPVIAGGGYLIASGFWDRLPMLREWPDNGEEISKSQAPVSRAAKVGGGLCIALFGLGVLIWGYFPGVFFWWPSIFALSMVAFVVILYLNRIRFTGRLFGSRAAVFWKNPAYSFRTKVLGGTVYIPLLVLLVWKLVGSNVPEGVFQICFWCGMILGVMTGYSAFYIDRNNLR